MKCYLCEEQYDPTDEELENCWDPTNWICPGCGEALDKEAAKIDDANLILSNYEEDYEHPF